MANTDILSTIQGLRAMLETLEAQVKGDKAVAVPKAPTAEKPKRQASDALKAWNAYVAKVKDDMEASGWTHPETGKPATRKDAMQEASRRRESDPDAHKPKPKEATTQAPKAEPSDGDAKPKPKKVLSEEHKAKLAEGRKVAAERRKAEKQAKAVTEEESKEVIPKPRSVSFAPPPLPPSDDEEESTLLPLNLKGKKYSYNPDTRACYVRLADGTQGDWAGIFDPITKSIDASVSERDLSELQEEE